MNTEPELISTSSSKPAQQIVAVLDLLGFSRALIEGGLAQAELRLRNAYLLAQRNSAGSFFRLRRQDSPRGVSIMREPYRVMHHQFSDTLLLWANDDRRGLEGLLDVVQRLTAALLYCEQPVRGGISIGEAIMDLEGGVFVGAPIIEASRLEHCQDWAGVAIHPTLRDHPLFIEYRRSSPPPLTIREYDVPVKPELCRGQQTVRLDAIEWPFQYAALRRVGDSNVEVR